MRAWTEHDHQRAFFAWVERAALGGFDFANSGGWLPVDAGASLPELDLFHAIPNGGARSRATAGRLKAEGVKRGVPDTFLPVPKPFVTPAGASGLYLGLYIEFKSAARRGHKNGGLSDSQLDFISAVRKNGYCARVAHSFDEAADIVMQYYGWKAQQGPAVMMRCKVRV